MCRESGARVLDRMSDLELRPRTSDVRPQISTLRPRPQDSETSDLTTQTSDLRSHLISQLTQLTARAATPSWQGSGSVWMHVGTVHGARECKVLVYVYDAGRGTQDPGRDGYWSDLDFELRTSNMGKKSERSQTRPTWVCVYQCVTRGETRRNETSTDTGEV